MKLVRFQSGDSARIGVVDGDQIVDVAATVPSANISASMREFLALGDEGLAAARAAVQSPNRVTLPLASTTLLAPVGDPQKVICIGQNYRDHCDEQNQPYPERAIIFCKFPTSITGPGAPIVLPQHISQQVDYEAELAFVVGKRAKRISEDEAKDYIAGYTCLNDVSARDIQLHPAEKQWIRGKSPDTFAPIGPVLVTADEIPNPQNLDIQLELNGEVRQSSNTENLIFGVYYLLSHISQGVTLEPGDVVATGTPGGVGMYSNPQVFLKPGDEVSVTISGIGMLTNPVVAEG
jgi:2-keto-4-pentenoate hydratase/2-oxohepta-3-ene-1,7-dioic acid hydratase in catechol pathway